MKVEYKNPVNKFKNKLKALPAKYEEFCYVQTQKQADELINIFKDGLKNDTFNLKRLKQMTIKQKKRHGASYPTHPLYDVGDKKKNTYYNLLKMIKIKNGYKVTPRKARHEGSQVSLLTLYRVHEKGMVINQPKMHRIINIPARPAFQKAYNRMNRKYRKDLKDLYSAIIKYANNDDISELNKLIAGKKIGIKNKSIDD